MIKIISRSNTSSKAYLQQNYTMITLLSGCNHIIVHNVFIIWNIFKLLYQGIQLIMKTTTKSKANSQTYCILKTTYCCNSQKHWNKTPCVSHWLALRCYLCCAQYTYGATAQNCNHLVGKVYLPRVVIVCNY